MNSRTPLLGVLAALILVASLTAVYELNLSTAVTQTTSKITQTGALIASSTASVPSDVSSSSNNPTIQWINQSFTFTQYPLAWGPIPVGECSGGGICIDATLGFVGQTTIADTSSTTIIESDTTTIIVSSTTTIIQTSPHPATAIYDPPQNTSYPVVVTAYIQDAATGANITASSGQSFLANTCYIQPTGLTHCEVLGGAPPGHTYKVTVYITKGQDWVPCSLTENAAPCASQLLAPPNQPVTIAA